jgi:hypothetical protein
MTKPTHPLPRGGTDDLTGTEPIAIQTLQTGMDLRLGSNSGVMMMGRAASAARFGSFSRTASRAASRSLDSGGVCVCRWRSGL